MARPRPPASMAAPSEETLLRQTAAQVVVEHQTFVSAPSAWPTASWLRVEVAAPVGAASALAARVAPAVVQPQPVPTVRARFPVAAAAAQRSRQQAQRVSAL